LKFSINLPGLMRYPPGDYAAGDDQWEARLTSGDYQEIARTIEVLGFDAITVPEHVVMPRDLVGSMGVHFPDALTAMTFIAGATSRIRVNSSVVVLPYHEPLAYAKAIATLDVLSGGRVTLTVGVGMARGEFAALGVPFEKRGKITDEYIEVLKHLWTVDEPAYHGEFVDFADVYFEPKPVQRPHPPIWIGGRSMAALRRAARVGDGWFPSGAQGGKGPWINGVADLPSFLDEARRAPGFRARESAFDIQLPITSTRMGPDHEALPAADRAPLSTDEIIDRVGALADAGVTWTAAPHLRGASCRSKDDYLARVESFAREVLPSFR
jgi:probable F420-dependent oxidoreductase